MNAPVTSARADRDVGVRRTREALTAAGYHCVASHILRETDGKTKCGDAWFYVGHGSDVLILKTIFHPRDGVIAFDVFAPLTTDQRVDALIDSIMARGRQQAKGGAA